MQIVDILPTLDLAVFWLFSAGSIVRQLFRYMTGGLEIGDEFDALQRNNSCKLELSNVWLLIDDM